MEKLNIDIFNTHNCPKISLSRDITINDIANIDERNNALLFILDDDKGWTIEGKKAILKIRFKLADEIKEKLNNNTDAVTLSFAMNFWKVHRYEVKSSEATPEKEDELKARLLELLKISMTMINQKADLSF